EAFARAWTLPALAPRFDAVRLPRGHVTVGGVSRDGRRLALAFNEKRLGDATGLVLDLLTGKAVRGVPPGVWPRDVAPNGRLLTGSASGQRLWDLDAGRPLTLPMGYFDQPEGNPTSHVLTGASQDRFPQDRFPKFAGTLPVAYDAETGEAITVGVNWRK